MSISVPCSNTKGKEIDLAFVGLGEPTTNGTSFIYNTELAMKLRQEPVKKGTNNKGSFGLCGATPWAPQVRDGKHNHPFRSVAREDFGTTAERAKAGDGFLVSADELQTRNSEMKKKQRAGAARRQQILFEHSVRQHEERMSEEKDRYDRAKLDYDNRTSKSFTHRGIEQRSQLTDLEQHKQRLDQIASREKLVRAQVPVRAALTPEPRLDVLLQQKEFDMSKMPVPLRAVSVAGTTSGIKGEAEAHVYPADKQRMKFNMLERARLNAGKGDLLTNGWNDSTSPLGNDKVLPADADTFKFNSMDADTKDRLDKAMAVRTEELLWRKEKEVRRQQAFDEKVQRDEAAAKKSAADAAKIARGGVDAGPTVGNRYNQLSKTYESLLDEIAGVGGPLGGVRVPKDMGIVKPATHEEMAAKEERLLALLDTKRNEAKSQVPAGRPSHINNSGEPQLTTAELLFNDNTKRMVTSKVLPLYRPNDSLGVNLSAELQKMPATTTTTPQQVSSTSGGGEEAEMGGGTAVTAATQARRYMHSPPVRALGGPRRITQPTRKDIDRELRTVRDGGHLKKHHIPLVKTLSPDRIHTIKTYAKPTINSSSGGGGGRGGGGASAMSPVPAPKTSMLL